MKDHLRAYKAFVRFSFVYYMAHRTAFVYSVIITVGWGLFQVAWIQILTMRTKMAFGWTRDELVILALAYTIVIGVSHSLFTRNFDRFSRIIDRGELDFLLIKPLDSQFIATTSMLGIPNFVRVVEGVVLLIVYLAIHHILLTVTGSIGFLVFTCFGVVLLYSLWLMFCTLLIWFPRLTNMIDFLYTINGVARFPTEMMYEVRTFFILFVIPFTFTVATPVKALVRTAWDGDMLWLVVLSIGFFITSRLFWRYALKNYTSASS